MRGVEGAPGDGGEALANAITMLLKRQGCGGRLRSKGESRSFPRRRCWCREARSREAARQDQFGMSAARTIARSATWCRRMMFRPASVSTVPGVMLHDTVAKVSAQDGIIERTARGSPPPGVRKILSRPRPEPHIAAIQPRGCQASPMRIVTFFADVKPPGLGPPAQGCWPLHYENSRLQQQSAACRSHSGISRPAADCKASVRRLFRHGSICRDPRKRSLRRRRLRDRVDLATRRTTT